MPYALGISIQRGRQPAYAQSYGKHHADLGATSRQSYSTIFLLSSWTVFQTRCKWPINHRKCFGFNLKRGAFDFTPVQCFAKTIPETEPKTGAEPTPYPCLDRSGPWCTLSCPRQHWGRCIARIAIEAAALHPGQDSASSQEMRRTFCFMYENVPATRRWPLFDVRTRHPGVGWALG